MEKIEDSDYSVYTSRQEVDKAINTLKGILLGVKMDKVIRDEEIKELKLWTLTYANVIRKNPFKDFMVTINILIETGDFDLDAIENIFWTCENMERDNLFYNQVTADLQILQGMCHGILSDGVINDDEILGLETWLNNHDHLNSYYPYDELYALILDILSDGIVEEGERKRLVAYFNQFVDIKDSEMRTKLNLLSQNIPINAICSADPKIDFDGRSFCFTGDFKGKTKSQLKEGVEYWGGVFLNDVTKKLDYLIVADNSNPAWAFACYGRKVEKALKYRERGENITIIHEFDYSDIIADM